MNRKLPFLLVVTIFSFAMTVNAQYGVSTVAGNGTQGRVDGPSITTAELYWPYGLAYDGDSVIYFSDGGNHCIRKISANTGKVTTIAGSLSGVSGLQDGIGANARFNWPDDVFHKNGYLYVGDNLNNCIRKIDLSTYSVTTIAGTGVAGYQDGASSTAMFHGGNGIALAVDNNNDIYVADGTNAVVRKISGGIVSTIAGTPGVFGYVDGTASSAKFHRPRYLALDTSTGALYITDINNNVIRKLYNNQVSTFAGTGATGAQDGAYNVATFSAPVGIAITIGGYFYVVDGGGNKLRKIDPSGNVSTIAGNGVFGFQDGAAANAEFYYPQDLCYDKHCFIYMADRDNNRIRRIAVQEGFCGVGIENITEIKEGVYPNPSSGVFSLRINNIAEQIPYKVYNTIGEEIKSGYLTYANNKLDLSNAPDGIYSLVTFIGNQTSLTKISLQK